MRLLAMLTAVLMTCACAAEVTPRATALPEDQMVFTVMSSGGLVPPVVYALESPSLALYGDGRALTRVKSQVAQVVPVRYEMARVDPAAVSGLVQSAQASGLFAPGTDFGKPRVTDLATTTVMVNGGDGPAVARAYAFDEQFETEMTPAQRQARAKLRALIAQADAVTAGAASSPYVPDRVAVYELDPRYPSDAATIGWPGPPPAGFLHPTDDRRAIACGVLTAGPAETVYRAALDNPGARWLVDGGTRVLAVNPLPLPGECA